MSSATRITHAVFCAILFACSATLLGLTAYHVHVTETVFIGVSFYVPIVVELLVTSCLAILLTLCAFIVTILGRDSRSGAGAEFVFFFIIWIMFLVGASVFSRGWHNISWCVSSRHVCRILSAIIAFSWINWVVTIGLLFTSGILMTDDSTDAAPRGRPAQTATTPVTNTTEV